MARGKSHDVVREYVARHPDAPARQLARMLRKDRPKLFPSVENARNIVRYVLGQRIRHSARGKSYSARDTSLFRPPRKPGDSPYFKLPLPFDSCGDMSPFVVPGSGTVLWLSDLQIPFHDVTAIEAALEFGYKRGITHILLGGDVMDFYAASDFERDPEQRDLATELFKGREFLAVLREAWPKEPILFIHGNHEERLRRFIWTRAPELAGLDSVHLPKTLDFEKYGVTDVGERRVVLLGKLRAIHGHEIKGSSPVNPARGLFLRGRETAICGHYHRRSEHSEPSALTRAQETACWSTGCLCELRPHWNPMNKWTHGFALIEFDSESGHFRVDNREIVRGKVY